MKIAKIISNSLLRLFNMMTIRFNRNLISDTLFIFLIIGASGDFSLSVTDWLIHRSFFSHFLFPFGDTALQNLEHLSKMQLEKVRWLTSNINFIIVAIYISVGTNNFMLNFVRDFDKTKCYREKFILSTECFISSI